MREKERGRERGTRKKENAPVTRGERLQLAKAVLSLEIEAGTLEPIYEWEIICNYHNTSHAARYS